MRSENLLLDTVHFTGDEHVLILNSAADPLVSSLAKQLRQGEVILAEDNIAACAQALTALTRQSKTALVPRKIAFHEYTLHEPAATVDAAVMNILYQPNNAWMIYGLQLAFYALKNGGRLYVEGAKERGILAISKRMEELFGNHETLEISKGRRVITSLKVSQKMSSNPEVPELASFAGGKMDEGTSLLLEALQVHVTDVALDLGCGAGFIGAYIAEKAHKGRVTLVDVSLASVAASQALVKERGLTNTQVIPSDGIQAVKDQRFSLIATNPPFHVGGFQTKDVAQRFIRETAQILLPRGRFYLVANRFLKYEPVLQESFGTVEEIGGNTRFKVLCAHR